VLVDAQGKTLYIFEPDNAKAMTCKGACAAIWPPLKLGVSKPVSAGSVKSSLLGSDPDPEGGRVVTYAGWPLYGYVGDPSPGIANGQAKNLTGGLWYVISPSGQVIKKAP
jgi:predicted lipoprotein with Yx(FWY)xxD motif